MSKPEPTCPKCGSEVQSQIEGYPTIYTCGSYVYLGEYFSRYAACSLIAELREREAKYREALQSGINSIRCLILAIGDPKWSAVEHCEPLLDALDAEATKLEESEG
jgi:hypothetical protein